MNRINATIGILTHNSAGNLARCLESVKEFAEIIIADGGSTDMTIEIAKKYGAHVISQSNPGHAITDFARERNLTLVAATQPWFFYLDSDEIMSPELVSFIRGIASDHKVPFGAYRVRYLKTNAAASKKYRTFKEYYQVRLVHTDIGARFERPVHERIEVPAGIAVGQTEAPWYVPLDAEDLSLRVFTKKAWGRIGIQASRWRSGSVSDAMQKIIVGPATLVGKSLIKMVSVKMRYGRNAIPARYELLRMWYALMMSAQYMRRFIDRRSAPDTQGQRAPMRKSVIYVFHGRFPDPRAATVFAVQEVKSLAAHVPVTMIVPKRDTTDLEEARTIYQLPEEVSLVALPILELPHIPFLRRFAFEASLISFIFRLATYFRHSSATWVITTDHLPALIASWCGKKVLIEVHDFPTTWNPIWRMLLARVDRVLSTNAWKAEELGRRFNVPRERVFVEPNGIDLERFAAGDKAAARRALGLPSDGIIALYTGNLYAWKGVGTLIGAAEYMPEVLVYILGGTAEDQERMRSAAGTTVHFVPRIPHEQVPMWQSAADVLVLPNTAKEEISLHHTSPMKLFEYMASERPIVASDLPSIREILPEGAGFFCTPDDPQALAAAIRKALGEPDEAARRAGHAASSVHTHTWEARARRLLKRL